MIAISAFHLQEMKMDGKPGHITGMYFTNQNTFFLLVLGKAKNDVNTQLLTK